VSVNFDELAAHLDRQRRKDTKAQFEERSTNATTAFLLCFFLGYLGAHRFYLGQWRSGLAHLVVFLLGAGALLAGFLSAVPLNAALYVIGGVLILASLIWEIVDLGRIDSEIHKRNMLLAEGLIAGALLSDPTVIENAERRLDEAVRGAAALSSAASLDPAATMPGMISATDLGQAKALAEESGRASISYQEMSNFTVSATPEERAGEAATPEPSSITESEIISEQPVGEGDAPTVEAHTHTHTEDGYRVTDIQESDRVSGPSAVEALGLSAAGLGYEAAEAARGDEEPVTPEPTPEPVADVAPEATPAPAAAAFTTPEVSSAEPSRSESDVTDASAPTRFDPTSDVAFGGSSPTYVRLPMPLSPVEASAADGGADSATTEAPIYFTPDEPAASAEPASESYIPPVPDVYSVEEQPQTFAPNWDAETAPVAPTTPTSESHDLAEGAGLGALGSAGALAAAGYSQRDAPVEPAAPAGATATPETQAAAEPAAPKMKRIRVKHRIVVEGQVVREEIVEREVPADADMAVAMRQIQEELEQSSAATPDQIARMANLSGDEEVEVQRRVEGLDQ
jgi:TM2 domain-containing membrane protein YozV